MAVALDVKGTELFSGTAVSSVSSSTSITVGSGANRALLLVVIWQTLTVPTAITFTWNSTALPLIASTSLGTSGAASNVQIYGMVNPTSGTLAFSGSWTGTREYTMMLVAYTGVDQTGGATSFPHGTTASGTSVTAATTITTANGNAVIGCYGNSGTNWSAVSNTSLFIDNANPTTYVSAANFALSTTSSQVLSATVASTAWVAAGCDILASSVAADTLQGMTTARIM